MQRALAEVVWRSVVGVVLVMAVRLYRDGLVLALKQSTEVKVIGAFSDVAALGDILPVKETDVALLVDVSTDSGLADLASIASATSSMPILALGLGESTDEILQCAEAGASGYVTRGASIAELVVAITGVARGEFACSARVAAALISRVGALASGARQRQATGALSARELEIVALIDDGLSNKQIATRLFITLATVKNHVHNILDKLGVEGRHDAAAWVRRQRLTDATLTALGRGGRLAIAPASLR